MSEVPNVNSTSSAPADAASGSTAPKGAAPGYSTSTKVSNLSDLKEQAPEVHKAMMEGIAQSIIKRIRASQERLKKMWDESRRQD